MSFTLIKINGQEYKFCLNWEAYKALEIKYKEPFFACIQRLANLVDLEYIVYLGLNKYHKADFANQETLARLMADAGLKEIQELSQSITNYLAAEMRIDEKKPEAAPTATESASQ